MKTRCFANMGNAGRDYSTLKVGVTELSRMELSLTGGRPRIAIDREQALELAQILTDFGNERKQLTKSWECDT